MTVPKIKVGDRVHLARPLLTPLRADEVGKVVAMTGRGKGREAWVDWPTGATKNHPVARLRKVEEP